MLRLFAAWRSFEVIMLQKNGEKKAQLFVETLAFYSFCDATLALGACYAFSESEP